jgi:signal transduction histidine kinase
MLRLYLRFYIALVFSLFFFVVAAAALWHFTGGPVEQAGVVLGRLLQNVLPSADSTPAQQQEALRRLTAGLMGDVALFDQNGMPVAAIGRPLPPPAGNHPLANGMRPWERGPVYSIHLADGRWLVASVPMGYGRARFVFHFTLTLMALTIGVAAFPIVRQISRRLERLQRGVESLGAGDLAARVTVEGRDEVARLAASFNRAASQIEQLVRANKALLANASHELRTPLARIRLAVELMKDSVDPKRRAGLEQDIAELDWLVDEILLASRLDAVTEPAATDEVDLLALAAEECARYDDVHLEGAPVCAATLGCCDGRCAICSRTPAVTAPRPRRYGSRVLPMARASRCGIAVPAYPKRNSRTSFNLFTGRKLPTIAAAPDSDWHWCGKSRAITAGTRAAKRWPTVAAASS